MKKEKVTLKDIAIACNLNPSMVSRVLQYDDPRYSEKTRTLIKETAMRMNYRPNQLARAMRTGKSGIVGLLIGSMTGNFQDEDFPADIVKSITLALLEANYQLLLSLITPQMIRQREVPAMLNDKFFEGVIAYGFHAAVDYVEYLSSYNSNIVLLEGESSRVSSVVHDDFAMGKMVADIFLARNYRDLAIVSADDDLPVHCRRCDGFLTQIAAADREKKIKVTVVKDSPWDEQAGVRAVEKLFQLRQPPQGIMVINDFMAKHVARFLLQHHLNCDVVGIGSDFRVQEKNLTIIASDRYTAGKKSVEILLDKLKKGKECTSVCTTVIPPLKGSDMELFK